VLDLLCRERAPRRSRPPGDAGSWRSKVWDKVALGGGPARPAAGTTAGGREDRDIWGEALPRPMLPAAPPAAAAAAAAAVPGWGTVNDASWGSAAPAPAAAGGWGSGVPASGTWGSGGRWGSAAAAPVPVARPPPPPPPPLLDEFFARKEMRIVTTPFLTPLALPAGLRVRSLHFFANPQSLTLARRRRQADEPHSATDTIPMRRRTAGACRPWRSCGPRH
jgi:hypothetical protein